MSDKTILFEKIVEAGITADRLHFVMLVRDATGNEARIAMPTSGLQRFAQIGTDLYAEYTRGLLAAITTDSGTIKF